eukprot:Amastigsp_a676675_77.p2 type:complete len:176 gc:universal Amastigsp_a676675_77:565-38(-)
MSEPLELELFPGRRVTALLFTGVSNSKELKGMLQRQELQDVALINAAMIVNRFHFLVAVNKALEHEAAGSLVTHALASEIIFALAPTRHISKAFTTFGVGPSTTCVLALCVDAPQTKVDEVVSAVKGSPAPLPDDWTAISDVARIASVYSLSEAEQSTPDRLCDSVVARMALRDL